MGCVIVVLDFWGALIVLAVEFCFCGVFAVWFCFHGVVLELILCVGVGVIFFFIVLGWEKSRVWFEFWVDFLGFV